MKKQLLIAAMISFLFTAVAQAHPGHGAAENAGTIGHFLFEPMHVLPLVSAFALAIYFATALRNKRKRVNCE